MGMGMPHNHGEPPTQLKILTLMETEFDNFIDYKVLFFDGKVKNLVAGKEYDAVQYNAGYVDGFVPVKVRPKISTALTDPDGKNSNGLVKIHGELFYPRACSGEG